MNATPSSGELLKHAPWWMNKAAAVTRRLPAGKSRVIDSLFAGSDKRFIGRACRELGGYQFDCCLRDAMARELFFAGCVAAQEVSLVRSSLRPGMSFVDVGANWGMFTLFAAHLVGPAGKVLALEPDPRIFAMLLANIERNHGTQVKALEVAAADGDSRMVLAGHDERAENWATSRLTKDHAPGSPSFNVQCRPLDTLLDEAGLSSIDLLKVDVEGAEHLVLRGMEASLRDQRYRRILLEVHPQQLREQGHNAQAITATLLNRGYRGYALDPSPKTARRAYYHPWSDFSDAILPLQQGLNAGSRHTVWLAAGEPGLV